MKILLYLIATALAGSCISHATRQEISIYSSRLENAAINQSPEEVANCLKLYFNGAQNESVANQVLTNLAKRSGPNYSDFLSNLEKLSQVGSFKNHIGNEIQSLTQFHELGFWQTPSSIQPQTEAIKRDQTLAALMSATEKNNIHAIYNTYLDLQKDDHNNEFSALRYLIEYANSLLCGNKVDSALQLISFFSPDDHDHSNDEIAGLKQDLHARIVEAKNNQMETGADNIPFEGDIMPCFEDLDQEGEPSEPVVHEEEQAVVPENEDPQPQEEGDHEELQQEGELLDEEERVEDIQEQPNIVNQAIPRKTSYSILQKIIDWTKRTLSLETSKPIEPATQKPSLLAKITSLFKVNAVYSMVRNITARVKSSIFSLW